MNLERAAMVYGVHAIAGSQERQLSDFYPMMRWYLRHQVMTDSALEELVHEALEALLSEEAAP